jgi:hypothetical protein
MSLWIRQGTPGVFYRCGQKHARRRHHRRQPLSHPGQAGLGFLALVSKLLYMDWPEGVFKLPWLPG